MNSIEYGRFEFQRLAFFMIHAVQGVSKKPQPRNFARNLHCFKDKRFLVPGNLK